MENGCAHGGVFLCGLALRMIKLGIILAIITVLLGAAWKALASAEQAGYDRAGIEFAEALDNVRTNAAEDVADNWRAALAIAGAETDVEIQIVETIRIVEREIPKYIDRIIEVKPECADLPELGSLFSVQAEASNNRSSGIAADPG